MLVANNLLQEIINTVVSQANKKVVIYGKGPIALLIKKCLEKNNSIGDNSANLEIKPTTYYVEKVKFIKLRLRYILEKSKRKRKVVMRVLFAILISSYVGSLIYTIAFQVLINFINDFFDNLYENLFAEGKIADTLYDELANETIRQVFRFSCILKIHFSDSN